MPSIRNRAKGGAPVSLASRADADASQKVSIDHSLSEDTSRLHGQIGWIILAVSCGVFLSAADKFIIVIIYGKIGSDLNALNQISWVATAYFLTVTCFEPFYGRLSKIFGQKPCLLFAYMCFGVGSVFCGLAQNIKQLIAGRVIQGIGGGGMTSVVSMLLSELVPLQDRGVWQGKINIVYAAGAILGAPLGGICADHFGWRWAFLAQAPICLTAFLAVTILLKFPRKDMSNWRVSVRRLDFLGAIILVGAVIGFLVGMDRGSNFSWRLPITISSLGASSFLVITFVVVEAYIAAEPFAPVHFIFERKQCAGYACVFFGFGAWISVLYYLPLLFQAAHDVSATMISIRLIPCFISGVSGSIVGGWLIRRTGRYYWTTVFAYGLLTAGLMVLFSLSRDLTVNTGLTIVGISICAFGNGMGVNSALTGIISTADSKNRTMVTAYSYLLRSLGSVIALGLSTAVVQHSLRGRLREVLQNNIDAEGIAKGLRQSLEVIRTLDSQMETDVRHCYGSSINLGFASITGMAFLAFFSALFVQECKLSR